MDWHASAVRDRRRAVHRPCLGRWGLQKGKRRATGGKKQSALPPLSLRNRPRTPPARPKSRRPLRVRPASRVDTTVSPAPPHGVLSPCARPHDEFFLRRHRVPSEREGAPAPPPATQPMLNRWPAVDGTAPVTAASSTTAIKATRTAGGLAHIQLRRVRRGRARAPRGTRTPRCGGWMGGTGDAPASSPAAQRRAGRCRGPAAAPGSQAASHATTSPPRSQRCDAHGRAGGAPHPRDCAPHRPPTPPDPWRPGRRCPVQSPPPVGHQIAGGAGGADSASASAGPPHGVAQPLRAFAGAHPLVATTVGEPSPPPQSRRSNSGAPPVEHHPADAPRQAPARAARLPPPPPSLPPPLPCDVQAAPAGARDAAVYATQGAHPAPGRPGQTPQTDSTCVGDGRRRAAPPPK